MTSPVRCVYSAERACVIIIITIFMIMINIIIVNTNIIINILMIMIIITMIVMLIIVIGIIIMIIKITSVRALGREGLRRLRPPGLLSAQRLDQRLGADELLLAEVDLVYIYIYI